MVTLLRSFILFAFLAVGVGAAILLAGPRSPLAKAGDWSPFGEQHSVTSPSESSGNSRRNDDAASQDSASQDSASQDSASQDSASQGSAGDSPLSLPQRTPTRSSGATEGQGHGAHESRDPRSSSAIAQPSTAEARRWTNHRPEATQPGTTRRNAQVFPANTSPTGPRSVAPRRPYGYQIGQLTELLEQLQNSVNQPPPDIDSVLEAEREALGVDNRPAASEDNLPPVEERLQVRDEGDGRTSISMYGADIRQVLDMFSVQGQLNVLTGPSVTGPVYGTLSSVRLDEALDAVVRLGGFQVARMGDFILVGTPAELVEMQRLSQRVVTRVYRPNYVTAEELLLLITPILSPEGTASVTSATATSTRSEQGISGGGDSAGGDNFAGNEVVLVRDLESVITEIDQLYGQLDRRPSQVSIEATILSVRLDDSNEFGVDFELLRNRGNIRLANNTPLASLGSLDLTSGGMKFGFLDSSLSSFISALETIGDANVVASPRLMCVNKQQAEILIGSELGYVSTTVTETAATQAVEFLEVGTQLRFRPFISDDGTVRLEIHPELSTGSVRIEGGFTLPDKEVTQVTTNIICPDSKTVIIGGLIREDLGLSTSQLPILGNIPVVGALFRSQTETKDRRELIVLLTPRIVDLPSAHHEAAFLGSSFMERQSIRKDKMSLIGRQYHARRFARLARAAWNAGDVDTARRYINLSLQFDPQLFESIKLRRQINAAHPHPESIDMHLRTGLHPRHQPTRDYSKDGYPWQPQSGMSPHLSPLPRVHVLDEGQPGRRSELNGLPVYEPIIRPPATREEEPPSSQ